MKEPIVHSGPEVDWEPYDEIGKHVQGDDGSINWRAAMAADPGCISCPACDETLWRFGQVVECPECGHVWDRRVGELMRRLHQKRNGESVLSVSSDDEEASCLHQGRAEAFSEVIGIMRMLFPRDEAP